MVNVPRRYVPKYLTKKDKRKQARELKTFQKSIQKR